MLQYLTARVVISSNGWIDCLATSTTSSTNLHMAQCSQAQVLGRIIPDITCQRIDRHPLDVCIKRTLECIRVLYWFPVPCHVGVFVSHGSCRLRALWGTSDSIQIIPSGLEAMPPTRDTTRFPLPFGFLISIGSLNTYCVLIALRSSSPLHHLAFINGWSISLSFSPFQI